MLVRKYPSIETNRENFQTVNTVISNPILLANYFRLGQIL